MIFDHIREAQRSEGQRLHSLLNHLDMTTSTCCICLGGEETASSNVILAAHVCGFDFLILCMHVTSLPCSSLHSHTHLVKDATLTDELLSGLGVDGYGKTNVWDKKLEEVKPVNESIKQLDHQSNNS